MNGPTLEGFVLRLLRALGLIAPRRVLAPRPALTNPPRSRR